MMDISNLVFIDCEATGLHNPSYPIEIGIATCDHRCEGYLIKPSPLWSQVAWDPKASQIHKITMDQLVRDGKDIEWIANWLNEKCEGKEVFSDNPNYENFWLSVLFRDTRPRIQPKFQIQNTYLLTQYILKQHGRKAEKIWSKITSEVIESHPPIHRAKEDALYWAIVCQRINEMPLEPQKKL